MPQPIYLSLSKICKDILRVTIATILIIFSFLAILFLILTFHSDALESFTKTMASRPVHLFNFDPRLHKGSHSVDPRDGSSTGYREDLAGVGIKGYNVTKSGPYSPGFALGGLVSCAFIGFVLVAFCVMMCHSLWGHSREARKLAKETKEKKAGV